MAKEIACVFGKQVNIIGMTSVAYTISNTYVKGEEVNGKLKFVTLTTGLHDAIFIIDICVCVFSM